MDYSIQLYSVRDGMKADVEGTLKAVGEMGYRYVEFAGFYGNSPQQINEMLAKYNLKISGTHSSIKELVENYDETLAYHKAIGNKNYIIPYVNLTNQDIIDEFVKNVNIYSEKLAAEGITLGFHNHSTEFMVNADGSQPYDQLLYRTNLKFEVDTYWAFIGMKNPTVLLDRISDRVNFIHMKDGSSDGKGTPLGMGDAPVADVYNKAKALSIPMVVESEPGDLSGLEESKICIDCLRKLEK